MYAQESDYDLVIKNRKPRTSGITRVNKAKQQFRSAMSRRRGRRSRSHSRGRNSEKQLDTYYGPIKFSMPNQNIQPADGIINGVDRTERFATLDDPTTFGVVPESEMIHNNMVPGSTKYANPLGVAKRAEVFDRKLQFFTGADNRPDWHHNQERYSLTKPEESRESTFGRMPYSDFIQSRLATSSNKNSVLPFEQEWVRPGVGIDPSKGGDFVYGLGGNTVRILPKTVNERRYKDNPKETYELPMLLGQKAAKPAVIGRFETRGNHAMKVLQDDDLLPKTAPNTGMAQYGKYNLEDIASGNLDRYLKYVPGAYAPKQNGGIGEATHLHRTARNNQRPANAYKPDTGISVISSELEVPYTQLDRVHVRDGAGPYRAGPQGINYQAYETKPTQMSMNPMIGVDATPMTGSNQGVRVFNYQDIGKATAADIHAESSRAGNAVTGSNQGARVFNYQDTSAPTMADIHAESSRAGNAVTGSNQGVRVFNYQDTGKATAADIHAENQRTGNAVTGNSHGVRVFNYQDTSAPTMADIHAENSRVGNAVTGSNQGVRVFNYQDIGKATAADIHAENSRVGNAVTGSSQAIRVFNYQDTSAPTMADTHAENPRAGNAVTGSSHGIRVFNYQDTGKATAADMHAENSRVGNSITGNSHGVRVFNYQDTGKTTAADIHAENSRVGNAVTGNSQAIRVFNYQDVPKETQASMTGPLDRAGNIMGTSKTESRFFVANAEFNAAGNIDIYREPLIKNYLGTPPVNVDRSISDNELNETNGLGEIDLLKQRTMAPYANDPFIGNSIGEVTFCRNGKFHPRTKSKINGGDYSNLYVTDNIANGKTRLPRIKSSSSSPPVANTPVG